jgi:hypothetical protein
MKLELLTNATVVDDAIRFVSKSNEKLKSSSEGDKEELREPDYDEDEDHLEEEQEEGSDEHHKSSFLMNIVDDMPKP